MRQRRGFVLDDGRTDTVFLEAKLAVDQRDGLCWTRRRCEGGRRERAALRGGGVGNC